MKEQPPIQCPYCQATIKHIPAGISKKTGKQYSEFWSCSSMDCDFTWRPRREEKRTEGLDMDKIMHGFAVLRGDIQVLRTKIDALEEKSIIYPKNENQE